MHLQPPISKKVHLYPWFAFGCLPKYSSSCPFCAGGQASEASLGPCNDGALPGRHLLLSVPSLVWRTAGLQCPWVWVWTPIWLCWHCGALQTDGAWSQMAPESSGRPSLESRPAQAVHRVHWVLMRACVC